MVSNPFETLEARLSSIENLILDLKHKPQTVDTSEQEDEFLTISQAAKLLHLSVPTMYCKTHRHELPFMKRGKRLYFSKTELLDYIKQGRKLTNDELKDQAHEYIKK